MWNTKLLGMPSYWCGGGRQRTTTPTWIRSADVTLVEMVLLRRCVTHTFSVEALARRVKCSLPNRGCVGDTKCRLWGRSWQFTSWVANWIALIFALHFLYFSFQVFKKSKCCLRLNKSEKNQGWFYYYRNAVFENKFQYKIRKRHHNTGEINQTYSE